MKNSVIILCKGIKLDKNYENVLSYSEDSMVSLCRNNKIYEGDKYTFLGNTNYIDIELEYKDAMYSNYLAFINPTYGNKWIFGWVVKVELLNPKTSRIYFEVDVWSTWYSRFNVGKAFIEREHVSDDTVGKHTVPEGLETGEYIAQNFSNTQLNPVLTNMFYLSDPILIAAVTTIGLDLAIIPSTYTYTYNGIYSGLIYLAFRTAADFYNYKLNVAENISEDNVVALFIVPNSITSIDSADWSEYGSSQGLSWSFEMALVPTSQFEKDMGEVNIPKPDHLDNDYIPVNKKLFTFPYCFLNVTNNAGITKDYHYELFNGNTWCNFEIRGSIGVGCCIKMYPKDYAIKGTASNLIENKLHAIDGPKLPTCPWTNDAFTNWLTSNAVNIGLSVTKDIAQIGLSTALGSPGGFVGGFMGIANTMATVYEHSLQPPTARGGTNQGDLIYAQRFTFNTYPMTIKKEYAVIIDRYFSRFGYKVNEVKTPNLKSRTKFNFIRVGGMDELISGNIPASDLEKINSIFRKGVTIFHNYSNIGDYTISNPIRS